MAEITKRLPDCDDDGERGERGKRGKRGKRGHRGQTGSPGPTGASGAFDLTGGAWTLKWSGLITADPAGVVQGLADVGTMTPTPPSATRYPFSSTRKATSFAVRTARNTLVGTTATVSLLKNGIAFTTIPAPAVGTVFTGPLGEVFGPGDVVEVQIVLPPGAAATGLVAFETTLDFEGPQGQTGPTGPGGTVPSNFVLKWSGRVTETSTASTKSLGDAGPDAEGSLLSNRYLLTDAVAAQRAIVRVEANNLIVAATIQLLKNGAVFESIPAPSAGGVADVLLSQVFASIDDIEVRVDVPSGADEGHFIALTAVVNFRGL